MNGQLAQQQGRYFHEELPVNNAAQPPYPLVTVTAETATSITSEHGHVFVPKSVVNYQHDLDGNLVSYGRWNYTWDLENRLVGMETLSSVPDGARRKLTFRYDYMGRRFYKSSRSWDAVAGAWGPAEVTRYVYDEWNLVAEIKNDIVVKRYTWGLDLSGTPQGAGGVGGLLSVAELQPDSTWKVNYAISDANGNVMKLVDAQTLDTVADYEYGPFGELIRMTGSRAKANPFRFSSKYQDDESGLLYYGYRYYDASVGRWISRDPIGERGGINEYAMVDSDPINYMDYLGLCSLTEACYQAGICHVNLGCQDTRWQPVGPDGRPIPPKDPNPQPPPVAPPPNYSPSATDPVYCRPQAARLNQSIGASDICEKRCAVACETLPSGTPHGKFLQGCLESCNDGEHCSGALVQFYKCIAKAPNNPRTVAKCACKLGKCKRYVGL